MFSIFRVLGLILLLHWAQAGCAAPTVVNGVLDLRGTSLKVPIEFKGDWEFYWEQLLEPGTIESHQNRRTLIKVPGTWNQDR